MNRTEKLKRRREFTAKKPERIARHLELIAAKTIRDNARDAYYEALRLEEEAIDAKIIEAEKEIDDKELCSCDNCDKRREEKATAPLPIEEWVEETKKIAALEREGEE